MSHRLLIFGFSSDIVSPFITDLLKTAEVESVTWIRNATSHFNPTDYPGIDVVEDVAALDPKRDPHPFGELKGNITLFDDAILSCYVNLKPTIIKMIDRMEKHGPAWSFNDREERFHLLFFFYLGLLKEREITFFFSADVPHEVTDFIIAELCLVLNIPTLFTHQIQKDIWIPTSHYLDIGTLQPRRLAGLSEKEQSWLDEASVAVIEKYDAISRNEAVKHFYMQPEMIKKLKRKTNLNVWSRGLKKAKNQPSRLLDSKTSRYMGFLFFGKKRQLKKDKRFNQSLKNKQATHPPVDQPFIYLALHYQPEMTTMPLAGVFVEQRLIITTLLSTFPKEVLVFVKEHPAQRLIGRHPDFYDNLPNSDRLFLLGPEMSTNELQEKSLAVATITGTVGLEALWRGKPVLVFGNAYYRQAPGAYEIKTVESAAAAAAHILSGNHKNSKEELLNWWEEIKGRAFPGNISDVYAAYSVLDISPEEQSTMLTKELVLRLQETDRTNQ